MTAALSGYDCVEVLKAQYRRGPRRAGIDPRAADSQFWLAYDLLTRLPAVHAAMEAGASDEPRGRVFSDWTTELRPEAARAVRAELLPRAPGLTTGQLIEQIKKLAIAIDPDWARRRYEQALTERKVVGYRNPDGSANLSGYNLPVDRVAAACGHIDALAKTANTPAIPARSTISASICSSA